MAVIRQRKQAATVAELRKRVRRELGDIKKDNTPLDANAKFTDASVDEALSYAMADIHVELALDESKYMLQATLAYDPNAAPVALSAGLEMAPITLVEIEDDNGNWATIDRVPRWNLQRAGRTGPTVYAFQDNSIILDPAPSANRNLRISYTANPFAIIDVASPVTPASDQHALPVAHEEYLILSAAIKLGSRDDVISQGVQTRYALAESKFLRHIHNTGMHYVQRTRRYT